MRVPLSWLKELIPTSKTPEEIGDILTLAGLEVDDIRETPLSFSGIIVAEVTSTSPHPEADKLQIASVHTGKETVQVVCGASNCRPGLRTAFATIGATLKAEDEKVIKIKKGKLRGIVSEGMLCGASELNLPGDNGGIMELSEEIPLGTCLSTLYSDTIFEISLTPNLGHCTSILGIARELSALTNTPLHQKTISITKTHALSPLSVGIHSDECSSYVCRRLSNVNVGPSPAWLSERLENAGIRSINNIVDVTNYVMLELGQPMHAFDATLLAGDTLIIDSSSQDEEMITLDEVQRHIPKGTLLIYDTVKPLAVAGVIGGASSSISDKTTDIVLEAAHFSPSSVRKSSKALNLRTESSSRFEKGVDPLLQKKAIEYATKLLIEIAGATAADEVTEICTAKYTPRVIPFSPEKCNKLLGTTLTEGEMDTLFKRLSIDYANGNATPPSYRNDITSEIDLVEEIARMYGYNNIPRKRPTYTTQARPHDPAYLIEDMLRAKCIALGLQEFMTCDLISPELAQLGVTSTLDENAHIPVLQPSSIDQSILRTSLLPGMLNSIQHNMLHGHTNIHAFEIGKIHFKTSDGYEERPTCALIFTGQAAPHSWSIEDRNVDFFQVKGQVENLLESIDLTKVSWEHSTHEIFHPGVQASIYAGKVQIGAIGEIHPRHTKALDIKNRVFFVQLDIQDIQALRIGTVKMDPLPQFPGSARDWTLTLPDSVPHNAVVEAITKTPSKILRKVELIDIYRSEKIGKDKKNVTLRLTYRSDTKTLAQEAVEKEHQRITSTASASLPVTT